MKRLRNILYVNEPNETSRHALEKVVSLTENNQARLTVVRVIERITAGIGMPDNGPISSGPQEAMRIEREQRLRKFTLNPKYYHSKALTILPRLN